MVDRHIETLNNMFNQNVMEVEKLSTEQQSHTSRF